ncbi:condensation domain-containing protein [Catelliglobosispora koreensis]|uniref:condensation domain-containing protein n=1 Tax=Catelliglobosispora koreensis TaxID=129052 RepID=UPI0003624B49|nr:condensation domain-containing protein [Catelliglobosispora koreensis]
MTDDTSYPMTLGQLSVWVDVQKMPPERRWEANLVPFVWDLPPGHTEEEVWDAFTALAMRHESLRTTYLDSGDGEFRQQVTSHDATSAMESVRRGTADVSERDALVDSEYRTNIDVTAAMPWRVWILTDGGVPAHAIVTLNHMAADGVGARIMQDELKVFLAGDGASLEPAPTPIELAIRQNEGEGASRIRSAERLWRKTLDAAPRLTGAEKSAERVGGILHTGIPTPLAHEGADKLDVTLASLILAAYYRGLREVTGKPKHLLYPMSNNRFDAETKTLVSSLNQWVPLLLEFGDDEPLTEVVQRTHWKAFNALKYGLCRANVTVGMRDEFEAGGGDPGHYFNPMIAKPGFPSADVLVPSHVEWFEPARATGPGFYLIVRAITSVDLVVRTNRPGYGKEEIEVFLASLQATLTEALGL